MKTDQEDLKHGKADDTKTNESESESGNEQKNIKIDKIDPDAVIQTKEEYFDALRVWLQKVQLQQMAYTYFPYYLSSNLQPNINNVFIPPMPFLPAQYPPFSAAAPTFNPQLFPQAANGNNQAEPRPQFFGNNFFQPNRNNYMDNVRQNMQILYQNGGYEYVIAPIWKRFLAEAIDVIILFIIKLMIVFMMIDLFNIQIVSLDFDSLRSSLEEDYLEFLSFSSDLLLVEILTKVMVCIYEAMWTAQGQSATPGKIIMGIRILYVEAVVPIGQIHAEPTNLNASTRALMYPASNPGFRRALLRAIAKNMLMTLMFPMCFVLLFFRNNRTGYDVMTKTIVVEENPVPIRRQL
ncbi:protein FAM8A1 [Sitodiplosis mosellana]|uniref:protein FAM8A1 n=1 Tax=Sitodiplosis mosellana TaxID=263140 RepID=UPI002444E209|nr:protein FAM8A1 [Sitodiplosis mosellana]